MVSAFHKPCLGWSSICDSAPVLDFLGDKAKRACARFEECQLALQELSQKAVKASLPTLINSPKVAEKDAVLDEAVRRCRVERDEARDEAVH
jgi:hypothetical protein